MNIKLSAINFKNYRSCRNTSLKLHPNLSILIGINGSGKTTVLNGIGFLRSLSMGNFRHLRERPLATSNCKISCTFTADQSEINYSASLSYTTDEDNDDQLVAARERWRSKSLLGSGKTADVPLWVLGAHRVEHGLSSREFYAMQRGIFGRQAAYEYLKAFDSKTTEAARSVNDFIRSTSYYSAAQFTDPSSCPPSFFVEEEGAFRRSLGFHRQHQKFMFDLYSAYKNNTNDWDRFISVVGRRGIRLVDNIKFREVFISSSEVRVRSGGGINKQKRKKRLIIPAFYLRRRKYSPGQLSEGTFKTLGLLFYLLTEKSQLLLIEEPEVCIHHGLLTTIVELIKAESKRKQIIISTHSDFVLDRITPDNVFLVTNVGDRGIVVNPIERVLGSNGFQSLKTYLANAGTLGEYWRQGSLENE
ncbi:MAG TPA: ATP-binding protein [Elusimicrobiota bacterium]|nr:ATP-binding protein [Elusimicrobiota bacterium]